MTNRYTRARKAAFVIAVFLIGALPAGAVPVSFDLVGVGDSNLTAHVVFAYNPVLGKITIDITNTSQLAAGPDPRFTAFAFNVPDNVTGVDHFPNPPVGWRDSFDRDAINTPGQYGKYDLAAITGPNFNGGSPNFGVRRGSTFRFTLDLDGTGLGSLTETSFLGLSSYDEIGPPGENEQYFIGRFQRTGRNGNGSDVVIPGPPVTVPEPLSLLLFGSGLTGLWWARRKWR